MASKFSRCVWGPDEYVTAAAAAGVASTVAMATLNAGWCARFTAADSRDIKGVYVRWNAVTSPGTVSVRIETIDATTGKPSGTLYDAAAVKAITPAAGWQAVTFDSLPTAGVTAGTEYALVLLTTTGGTTQTLLSHCGVPLLSGAVLTASDGTTRSNFAETTLASPVCTFVLEDDEEAALGCCPFGARNLPNIGGTNSAGLLVQVPPSVTLAVDGVLANLTRFNTPAGDLRARVIDSGGTTLATSTRDKDSLTNSSGRRIRFPFAAVTLAAGTYRVVLDSAASVASDWRVATLSARSSGVVPAGFSYTSTADNTATPVVWTDVAADLPAVGLMVADMQGVAAGNINILLLGAG